MKYRRWFKLIQLCKKRSHNDETLRIILKCEASALTIVDLFLSKMTLHYANGGKLRTRFFSKIVEIQAHARVHEIVFS